MYLIIRFMKNNVGELINKLINHNHICDKDSFEILSDRDDNRYIL